MDSTLYEVRYLMIDSLCFYFLDIFFVFYFSYGIPPDAFTDARTCGLREVCKIVDSYVYPQEDSIVAVNFDVREN